ncbi:MAG: hypothetical protein ACOCR6_03145 [archaeon]
MRNRWRVFMLLAMVVLAVSTVGTGAFTSTTADRSVTVDVVGDEHAHMALEYDTDWTTIDENEEITFLTVQNQFVKDDIDIDVSPSIDNNTLNTTWENRHGTLDTGENLETKVAFECADDTAGDEVDVTLSFDVTADGDEVFVETTEKRTVEFSVQCQATTDSATTST